MKIPRWHLICATEKMLFVLGVRRKQNHGWLKAAMKTEFGRAPIEAFYVLREKREKKRQKESVGKLKTDFKPVKATDGRAEQFANELYEKCGRDLSERVENGVYRA